MTSTRTKAPAEKPMPARTLKALKGSVRKWEKIVAGDMVDKADANCPLCQMFARITCDGCPVKAKSGQDQCWNTPYLTKWKRVAGLGHTADSPAKKKAAEAELRFLKSLLPRRSRAQKARR